MVDKTGLKIIGCIFGGTTAVVVLVAALLVGSAMASGEAGTEAAPPRIAAISPQA
jgi:hypothetical protein